MDKFITRELVYALLAAGGGLIGSYALGLIKKLSEDVIADKIRGEFAKDLLPMQKRLFGLGEDVAVIRSRVQWVSADKKSMTQSIDVPIYNWNGLTALALELGIEFNEIKDDKTEINGNFNILSIGGSSVNKYSAQLTQEYDLDLPYKFVKVDNVPEQFRPETPIQIERKYKCSNGIVYRKPDLERQKFLIDVRDPLRPPLGPVYENNQLIEDVLLITVLPAKKGKKKIIIRPGYGAASKIADIFCSTKILPELYKEITSSQPFSYFQAVFRCSVQCTEDSEIYGVPEIEDIRPLILKT